MNLYFLKEELKKNLGRKVKVTVYGMRNKKEAYEGVLYKMYPNIFTIMYLGEEKSFSYRDIITKDISLKYV